MILYSQLANLKNFISKYVNVLSKVPVYLLDILRDISENLKNISNVVQKRKAQILFYYKAKHWYLNNLINFRHELEKIFLSCNFWQSYHEELSYLLSLHIVSLSVSFPFHLFNPFFLHLIVRSLWIVSHT